MSYRPLKKDLTNGTQNCHFCGVAIRSLKAYILENIDSKEKVFSGPDCAKQNIHSDYKLGLIPDLTKYTLALSKKEGSSTNRAGDRTNLKSTDEEQNLRKAIEYLELRENKLAQFFNTSFPKLKNYFNSYLISGELKKDEIQHILNIEKNAPDTLKLINLQKCYNYFFWIDIGIGKLGGVADEFLIPIKNYLIKNLKISEKQKIGVNKWLKNIDGVPQLK